MAIDLVEIRAILSGGSQVATEAKGISASVESTAAAAATASKSTVAGSSAIASSLKKQSSIMKETGGTMSRYISLPLLAISAYSIKASLDFNQSMALIQTQAGASAKELSFLKKGVQELAASGKTGFTDNELAEGLYAVRSAGIKGARALDTLRAASDFAEVGQAGLAETTKALVSAQNSGIKGTKHLHEEMGTLNAVIGAGQMHMGELNSAISTGFLGTAKALGLNLTEVGGSLAFLTREGTPATAAATRLRMAFSLIANPTEKAVKALEGIGLSQTDLAQKMRGPNGAVKAFELLRKHLSEHVDLTTKIGKTEANQILAGAFGGAKSGGTILQIIGNMQKLRETTAEVHNNTGKIGADIRKAEGTGEEKLKHTWSQLNNALVELGEVLAPVIIPMLKDAAQGLTTMLHGFTALPGPVKLFVEILTGLLVVAGPLLVMVGSLAAAFAALGVSEAIALGPVTLIVVGLAALAAGFIYAYKHVTWFHNAVDAVFNFVKEHWRLLLIPFAPIIGPILVIIANLGHLKEAWGWIKTAASNVLDWFQNSTLGKVLTAPLRATLFVIRHLIEGYEKVKSIIESIEGSTGPPTKADPSLVTPGTPGVPGAPHSTVHHPGSGIAGPGHGFEVTPLSPRPRKRRPGEVRPSNRLSNMSGSGGRTRTQVPVQFVVDKRVLAEGVVEVQEDDEARR